MSSDNGGLSKLGTALTILFVLSLAALFAELFYLLWRHRRRQPAADEISESSDSTFSSSPKELLYFFCITTRPNNNNSQIQNSVTGNNESGNMEEEEEEVIDIDLMKIGGMFGPPRFLFTIKEEERELEDDVELDEDKKVNNNKKKKKEEGFGIRRTSLVDCFMEVEKESVDTTPLQIDDTTPFSTPCASPLYFTPSASPAHVVAMEEGRVFSEA